ncbi:DUF3293 domain-containing protein [Arenimonas donghaensis]|uniref:DUF3293 domain-containing protein n=1 Tax=Arenimonas donghaensis DSM 18148 = HO3-R19 TaxID=1121014 RepID=A0A087MK43_9GAMM|nr:DUF3293 domain-containing protein [Arenimonas donghaensis]KFL37246.1 hypothetical protein N788_10425 [Arenimonas donghaensis DSM 18148 = HO3-R19]
MDPVRTYPPPAAMMQAFADAVYRVYDGDRAIPLYIGRANPALAALLARHGASHGGLVTGENPFGQVQSPEENATANQALREAIDAHGLARVDSDGGSEDGGWNEPGFMVIGGGDAVMDSLARRFRQAAWVRIDADGIPTLAPCRYPLAGEGDPPCWPAGILPASP